jgi:hypothetical protein
MVKQVNSKEEFNTELTNAGGKLVCAPPSFS